VPRTVNRVGSSSGARAFWPERGRFARSSRRAGRPRSGGDARAPSGVISSPPRAFVDILPHACGIAPAPLILVEDGVLEDQLLDAGAEARATRWMSTNRVPAGRRSPAERGQSTWPDAPFSIASASAFATLCRLGSVPRKGPSTRRSSPIFCSISVRSSRRRAASTSSAIRPLSSRRPTGLRVRLGQSVPRFLDLIGQASSRLAESRISRIGPPALAGRESLCRPLDRGGNFLWRVLGGGLFQGAGQIGIVSFASFCASLRMSSAVRTSSARARW